MIITKDKLFKKVKTQLKQKYPNEFIFGSKNKLWDYSVYTIDDDRHFKIVFEQDELQILTITKFLKGHVILNSKINRKYFIIHVQRDLSFKYVQIV